MRARGRVPRILALLAGVLLASACRRSECEAYQDEVMQPLRALQAAGDALGKLAATDRATYLAALDRQIAEIDRAVATLRAVQPEGAALRSAHADLVHALTTWADALHATRGQILAAHPDHAALEAAQRSESKAAQAYGAAEARVCDACDWEPPRQN